VKYVMLKYAEDMPRRAALHTRGGLRLPR
jgi:hypothetical protein